MRGGGGGRRGEARNSGPDPKPSEIDGSLSTDFNGLGIRPYISKLIWHLLITEILLNGIICLFERKQRPELHMP